MIKAMHRNSGLRRLITLALFIFIGQGMIHATQLYYRVSVDLRCHSMEELLQTGVACDHGGLDPGKSFTGEFSQWEMDQLDAAGIKYKILIEDLSAYYEDRLKDSPEADSHALIYPGPCAGELYPVPANFNLGSMGGYLTYAEMLVELDQMAALYPNLISPRTVIDGSIQTHEGNDLYWMRISDEPNTDSADPEILYTALHHAREPESLMQMIYFMWYLLENYGTDEEVTNIVDHTELYFIPCVNPDGYLYNEATNPNGGGMWRKNRRNNGGNSYGVDLNRNYAYQWGIDNSGSSGNPSGTTYRGPSPFSEPETQLVRDFVLQHDFKVALNYHSYGNYVFMPWGYQAATTPDHPQYRAMGKVMTHYNCYNYGTYVETGSYGTNGDADDWMYGEQDIKDKIISCTPEVGGSSDGFWPEQDRIIPLAEGTVWQNLASAYTAGKAAELHETSSPEITNLNASFDFDFQRLGLTAVGTYTVTLQPLSSNIASVAAAITFDNMAELQVSSASLAYTLDVNTKPGEEVSFRIEIDNGDYTVSQDISKHFQPEVLLVDDFSSVSNWTTNAWSTTLSDFRSAPSCITDSPTGNYANGFTYELETNEALDLTDAEGAMLSFWAKWDIENCYDRVTVSASTDGNNWTALCGRYTDPGTNYQDFEPSYDDDQLDWVREVMDLSDFAGSMVYLRFALIPDSFENGDGFFMDDLEVYKFTSPAALQLSAVLEGPYLGSGIMSNTLSLQGLLPLLQPFNAAPWSYTGSEQLVSLPANAVDWVLVELRSAADASAVVAQQAGILMVDGTVQSADGISELRFPNATAGSYYVVLRHKSHMDIMTENPVDLSLSNHVDFRDPALALANNQCKLMSDGVNALAAGDFNGDGIMSFDDYNVFLGNPSDIWQYLSIDTNLDGLNTVLDFNLYKENYTWIGLPEIRY